LEAEKEKLLDTVASMTSRIDELESDRAEKELEIRWLKDVVYSLEQTNSSLRFQIAVNTITTSSSKSKINELDELANDLIGKLNDEEVDTITNDDHDLDSKASSKKSIALYAGAYHPTPVNGPSSDPNAESNRKSSWFWFGTCL
jgi:vacuolar-type H+-ATPase subunit I/STV1